MTTTCQFAMCLFFPPTTPFTGTCPHQSTAAPNTAAALASPFVGNTGTWSPALPSYRGDLRSAVVANANKLALQVTPTSIITTKGAGATAVTNTWDAAVPAMELLYGETYEARLVSPNHPLHLHIYPMQVDASAHLTPTHVPLAQPQAPYPAPPAHFACTLQPIPVLSVQPQYPSSLA